MLLMMDCEKLIAGAKLGCHCIVHLLTAAKALVAAGYVFTANQHTIIVVMWLLSSTSSHSYCPLPMSLSDSDSFNFCWALSAKPITPVMGGGQS